jgi:hypothetical protein
LEGGGSWQKKGLAMATTFSEKKNKKTKRGIDDGEKVQGQSLTT